MGNSNLLKLTKIRVFVSTFLTERSTIRGLLSFQFRERFKLLGSSFSSNISSNYRNAQDR